MRKHKARWIGEVDLDNPKTYKHYPKTDRECDDKILERIGYTLLYMNYFVDRKFMFPKKKRIITKEQQKKYSSKREADSFINCGYYQRMRIMKLIKNFADNRQKNWGNLKWFQEQLFLFDDETENMC